MISSKPSKIVKENFPENEGKHNVSLALSKS